MVIDTNSRKLPVTDAGEDAQQADSSEGINQNSKALTFDEWWAIRRDSHKEKPCRRANGDLHVYVVGDIETIVGGH